MLLYLELSGRQDPPNWKEGKYSYPTSNSRSPFLPTFTIHRHHPLWKHGVALRYQSTTNIQASRYKYFSKLEIMVGARQQLIEMGQVELLPSMAIFYCDLDGTTHLEDDVLKVFVADKRKKNYGDINADVEELMKLRYVLLGDKACVDAQKQETWIQRSHRGGGNLQGNSCITFLNSREHRKNVFHVAKNMGAPTADETADVEAGTTETAYGALHKLGIVSYYFVTINTPDILFLACYESWSNSSE